MSTRKHFELVASIIRQIADEKDRTKMAEVAIEFFKKENPRFDEQRFRFACAVLG